MNFSIIPIVGIFAILLASFATSAPEFKPAGMKVVWQSLGKEFDGFKTYNADEGVYVSLVAKSADKTFIGFTEDASKVVFKDKDTDLGGKFGFWEKISKDGSLMRLDLQSKKLPAESTTSVQLQGNVQVLLASKVKTLTVQASALKTGDKLELDNDMSCTIKSIGKPKWGDEPLQIEFEWKRSTPAKIPELKEVRFYGEDGKLIESSALGTTWGGAKKSYTTTKSFKLKKSVQKIKIEMDVWEDLESVDVPLDMNLQLGGGG